MKPYGQTDEGTEIQMPDGWKLLPEGERVPSVHCEANSDGTWCRPRRCCSTMTPIYARVAGYVRAIAVPVDYNWVPEGATDVVRDTFKGDFGHQFARVTYFKRSTKDGLPMLLQWLGQTWREANHSPWAALDPLDAHESQVSP